MSCTVDCLRDSCQSATHMSGVCYLPATSSQSQCELMGAKYNTSVEWYAQSLCVLTSVQEPSDCEKVIIFPPQYYFNNDENFSISEHKSKWKLGFLQFTEPKWMWKSECHFNKHSIISFMLHQSVGTMLDWGWNWYNLCSSIYINCYSII